MHRKWNINIFVIFVLLAVSLLGLLTVLSVQRIMNYRNLIRWYAQSYYYAKAGIETMLTLKNSRGLGFEYVLGTWLFSSNFECDNCEWNVRMVARNRFTENTYWQKDSCDSGFVLWIWELKLVAMFYDKGGENNLKDLLEAEIEYENLLEKRNSMYLKNLKWENDNIDLIIWLVWSGKTFIQNYSGLSYKNLSDFWNSYSALWDFMDHEDAYLVFANNSNEELNLCFGFDPEIRFAQDDVLIDSFARWRDFGVSLNAIIRSSVPWFLIQGGLMIVE